MVLSTFNPKEDIVAIGTRTIRVRMIGAVIGEDAETLEPGKVYTVSEPFGRELIRRGKAVEAVAEPQKATASKRDGDDDGGKQGKK